MSTNDLQAPVFVSTQPKSDRRTDRSTKQTNSTDKQITKPVCTRCGTSQLIDITQYEFPKQKGLVFECMSCGNNSLRSNVSDDERKRRLAKVATDHLDVTECKFCHGRFHVFNDYLKHLQNDHGSNKPK